MGMFFHISFRVDDIDIISMGDDAVVELVSTNFLDKCTDFDNLANIWNHILVVNNRKCAVQTEFELTNFLIFNNMSNKYREIEIDLIIENDVNFILDVIKNKNVLVELYSSEYDGEDHLTSVLYVNEDDAEEFYAKNEVFENISHEDYELDEDSIKSLKDTRNATIDDLHELKTIYAGFEKLIKRYDIGFD